MKNIESCNLPSIKKFAKRLKRYNNKRMFNIIYEKHTPVYIIVNNLLNRIDYSFVCNKVEDKIYYSVKPYKMTYIS